MSDDADAILESLREHRQRAIQGINASNPDLDIDEPADLYSDGLDVETHTLELELDDFQLAVLTDMLYQPLSEPMPADQVVYFATLLERVLEAAPEHVDRMAELGEDLDAPRGFQ